MFRAVLELLFTIVLVMVARAVLTSLMKGVATAARSGQPNSASDTPPPQNKAGAGQQRSAAGELHKDPVCGTYVAESTQFRRQTGGQTFYYCSEACREKHSLVARQA